MIPLTKSEGLKSGLFSSVEGGPEWLSLTIEFTEVCHMYETPTIPTLR